MTQEQVRALNEMTKFGRFTVTLSYGQVSIERDGGQWVLKYGSYQSIIHYGQPIEPAVKATLHSLYDEFRRRDTRTS